jgi:hypothetical protein
MIFHQKFCKEADLEYLCSVMCEEVMCKNRLWKRQLHALVVAEFMQPE